ncbi:hypothetical protein [Burkholderia pseudomallei]|uniref:hypothetical protein n=1 Tax=Burkholderia pseudomallei TaxID=28450 RepID=UPI0012B800B3
MEDYVNIDETYRLRLIKRTALPEATHVAISQIVKHEDGEIGVTDGRFALERQRDGTWVELKEAELSESVYLEVRPKILQVVTANNSSIFGERLSFDVHVPVLAHRLLARKIDEASSQ